MVGSELMGHFGGHMRKVWLAIVVFSTLISTAKSILTVVFAIYHPTAIKTHFICRLK